MRPLLSIWRGELRERPPLAELLAEVAGATKVGPRSIRSQDRFPEAVRARHLFARLATSCGWSQSAVARFLGRHPSTIHNAVRVTRRLQIRELRA